MLTPVLFRLLLWKLGFRSGGILAGSPAASFQSSYGVSSPTFTACCPNDLCVQGSSSSNSVLAVLQSLGAVGLSLSPLIALMLVGAWLGFRFGKLFA